jgi:mono/diheme cytochrome c family protein
MLTKTKNCLPRRWSIAGAMVCVATVGLQGLQAAGRNAGTRTNSRASEQQARAIPAQASPPAFEQGTDAAAGQALFTGHTTFQNRGPSCSTCHGISNLSVSHGPTPGADLTHEYSKIGPDALNGLLTQPPFTPMNQIYEKSPLTPSERRELIAFLQQVGEMKPAGAPATAPPTPEEISAGEALFDGRAPMQNGGPACATCHTAADIPFPYGGTMGPDLTREYSKLGPQGMAVALKTLYFPAMNPLFEKRPLTENEQSQLAAFFQSIDQNPPPPSPTMILLVASIALLVLFFLWTWLAVGRRRLRSVRRALLERAGAAKGNR